MHGDPADDAPQRRHAAPSRAAPGQVLSRLAARYTGVRIVPGRGAAVAVGLLALALVVATVCWVLAARPHAVAVGTAGSSAHVSGARSGAAVAVPTPRPRTTRSGTPARASPAVVVVDVAGKVRHPGVYRLRSGSRVNDAIAAAGGALPHVDLSSLNLAAPVHDGEQIAVGVPGAGPAPGTPAGAGDGGSVSTSAAPVALNTASLSELEQLPGVGPVLAQHILDWRAAHGRFVRVEQLQQVPGIGPVTFASLRDLVTV